MAEQTFNIAGRDIGPGIQPYIIAELSGNHNGDLERAFKIMEAAKAAGVDAIKLQTYTPDTMTIDMPKKEFIIKSGLWDGYTLYDLYKLAQTPWEWHEDLFAKGRELDITVFSSPFDDTAVDFLENLNNPAYKIASFEIVDLPLIKRVSETGKPIIISTGMANLDEIDEAVNTAREAGCKDLALLHCVSGYPTPPGESNLRTIVDIEKKFGVVVGLSDHTLGSETAIASVGLGASLIEKHITLNRKDSGPDAAFSLEPREFKSLCKSVKIVWNALGKVTYECMNSEKENTVFRRSLYVVEDIMAGEEFTTKNVHRIRPANGLPPKYLSVILGRRSSCDIERGTALSWDFIAKNQ